MKYLNWSGSVLDTFQGFGRHTLKFMEAVQSEGTYHVRPLTPQQLWLEPKYLVWAGITPTDPLFFVGRFDKLHISYPGKKILNTMYESTLLPSHWAKIINKNYDLLVLPSAWLEDVFHNSGVYVPIHIISEGIDPTEFPISTPPVHEPFVFLCIADRGVRKNWENVWRAFITVFEDNNDVRLIIKMRETSLDMVTNFTSLSRNVLIWRYDAFNMKEVYSLANCFVFPSRGEGYGLPPRETAAMGIPTIALAQHGTADVQHWGLPLEKFTMRPSLVQGIDQGYWFEPDFDELCEKMLWVYNNYTEALAIAKQGAAWLHENQTWELAAKKLVKVLEL